MKALRIRPTLFALGVALLAPATGAQVPADEIPPAFEEPVETWVNEDEIANSPFHRQRFADTYADDIAEGGLRAVLEDLVARFDARDWGANEPRQQKILRRLDLFRAAVVIALGAPPIEGPLDTKLEQNVFLQTLNEQQFGLHTLQMETLRDPSGEDVPGYFKGTADELPLYRWEEDGESVELLLTEEQVRQWRLLQNALSNLLLEQVFLVREANLQALRDAVERWENYLDKGYSQMPWESLANGWLLEAPELGPPDRQWILLHPSFGIEVDPAPLDEANVKAALCVEVLGHLWYHGAKLEDYWGLSATVTLREDLDPGIGAMVHIQRNWNLGITWHDVDEDPFLFLSVDLFRFAKQKAPEYVAQYESLRERLGLD